MQNTEQKRDIKLWIKDIGEYTVPAGTTILDLTARLKDRLPYLVTAAIVNYEAQGLDYVLQEDDWVELLDLTCEYGLRVYRRTAVFLMLKAFNDLFPEKRMVVRHSLSNGLLCETVDEELGAEEVALLETRMQEIVEADLPINRLIMPRMKAAEIFAKQNQPDKADMLDFVEHDEVWVYELGGFFDYFFGFMLPRTGMVNLFKLLPYEGGLILQTPEMDAPDRIKPYIEQKKLAYIFKESKRWAEMLETPHAAALNKLIAEGRIDEIIRINEALHEKKVALIAEEICKNKDVRLVLISGPSSSGKTTFAQRLYIQLRASGRRPVTISLDDYFVDRENTPRDEKGEYDFEALEALKLDLFNEHLTRLIKGEEVEVPIFNFITGRAEPRGKNVKVPPGEVIIIEGIHALNDKLTFRIPQKQKFKIYVSALTQLNLDNTNRIPTTDSRLIRRMVRDSRTRGYSARDTIRIWPSVRRGEEKNIFPFQESADVMFNTSLVYEFSVLRPFAEPLLREITPDCPEYHEARRLLRFLSHFTPVAPDGVPFNSILREFIGGSPYKA
ncbi:uridine kinase [Thermosyntropha lipolytica DSM 11003]|uniref:Uridine kinase n=1 Tax=Thermosyntropha lipolytica DSM 11003 TaxID=1123382 RepID=A0A1M5K6R0_9FIRM|nr:nucleoside kinase [Thermosyntropha lipolytica]SHG47933.1 uridine kinase [Thermosyntropha lipolytica DSM 11003]